MANARFDRVFGEDFLASVPRAPGVYRYRNAGCEVVYVGKANDLRARLAQYRNATRKKVHRKLRAIVRESASLEWQTCASEEAALLLENEEIRALRPLFNVQGAFSFLYPVIGVRRSGNDLDVVYSSDPDALRERGFSLFGAYRNRGDAREGFDAIVALLERWGHREGAPERIDYSAWRRFRQVPAEHDDALSELLKGGSEAWLGEAALALVERASARRDAKATQRELRAAARFYAGEASRLAALCAATGLAFVPQEERDSARIRADFASRGSAATRKRGLTRSPKTRGSATPSSLG